MVKNRVKQIREQKRITQIQMAKDLQITRQTVIAIEKNGYNPSLELALKIAAYFDMPVEKIFWLSSDKEGIR